MGAEAEVDAGREPTPSPPAEPGAELHAISISLEEIDAMSSVRVTMPKDVATADGRFAVLKVCDCRPHHHAVIKPSSCLYRVVITPRSCRYCNHALTTP